MTNAAIRTGNDAPDHAGNAVPMIRMMGLVSLICGLLIVATHINTLARIRHNQETIMQESVGQLLPGVKKQVVYGMEPSGELKIMPGLEGEGSPLVCRLRFDRKISWRGD